ncbi:UDP-N-acetylglucosamine 1-carboxyvinyltransferase [Candidatus Odyssella acanthamoebae]|uniref:UDP-N-acetylglucosamine 1-carboxyvinyltransferase n=1 Tax=Candidatus Odyssella acanthamoebae TaxID=91604 RepID=A0A077AZ41_9PROT|nr:UDP-N-acetylglucosamine 1-carboxyvinyltransferase [Candidatus Paracaedibacter acanthamoebae]AIK96913.1 UDP-N-acetylglucosamine 1-carboxyvinyltransferase [Candidatus Paracaedibacter acanthamoebae]
MDQIRIIGGTPLRGTITISGAKNAALPLLTAALLSNEALELTNIPDLADIKSMIDLLEQHGLTVSRDLEAKKVTLNAQAINNTTAPYDIVRKMRASILVLGPLVARCGEARVSLPGGCSIGTRPVDIHLRGLEELGAKIELKDGYINAEAPNGLRGATITMPIVSVTATENLMMAATLAKGTTKLINAAREPEIVDLANCLRSMGANIQGDGTDTITIEGVSKLHKATHRVIADRIETGTFAIAAAITGGELYLKDTSIDLLPSFISSLQKAGVIIEAGQDGFWVKSSAQPIAGVDIMTEPYPGFATDLQAQMMALMTVCQGASMMTETIFENRFMHVPELCRMGANITVHGSSALVRGVSQLRGAPVMATDLRASVSLVLAGLAAEGETILSRVYHLDRGYEHIETKLRQCGAHIERIKEKEALAA